MVCVQPTMNDCNPLLGTRSLREAAGAMDRRNVKFLTAEVELRAEADILAWEAASAVPAQQVALRSTEAAARTQAPI